MVRLRLKRIGCGLGALLAAACSPSTVASTTGAPQRPREDGCNFPVLTVLPEGYQEIGVIDFKPSFWNMSPDWTYTELNDVKRAIAPEVCRAGGDAALAMANGTGHYEKVTILKRVSSVQPAQPVVAPLALPSAPAVAVAAPAAAPAADLGCHFDTQCKGDRVCTEGRCMPPVPPAKTTP